MIINDDDTITLTPMTERADWLAMCAMRLVGLAAELQSRAAGHWLGLDREAQLRTAMAALERLPEPQRAALLRVATGGVADAEHGTRHGVALIRRGLIYKMHWGGHKLTSDGERVVNLLRKEGNAP